MFFFYENIIFHLYTILIITVIYSVQWILWLPHLLMYFKIFPSSSLLDWSHPLPSFLPAHSPPQIMNGPLGPFFVTSRKKVNDFFTTRKKVDPSIRYQNSSELGLV